MSDLFSRAACANFEERAIVPALELGAYEALWAKEDTWFKSLAELFRRHPGSVPSDFVAKAEAEHYARLALGAIRAARVKHFGIRVNGAGDYPPKLRDAEHPVELLYFQGNWDLTSTRSVAIVGTRNPSEEGRRRAAKLARLFVRADYTVVSGLAQGIDTVVHTTAMEVGGADNCSAWHAHHSSLSEGERAPSKTHCRRVSRHQSSADCEVLAAETKQESALFP